MNDELKIAITAADEAHKAMVEAASMHREAAETRDELQQQLDSLAAGLESAESAHAEAVAGAELGEDADPAATAAALAQARRALDDAGPDLRHRLRVADVLVSKLQTRYLSANALHAQAVADLNAARIAVLEAKAKQAIDGAGDAVAALIGRIAEVQAARRVLEAHGGKWIHGAFDPLATLSNTRLDHNVVELMIDGLQAEIGAAGRP